MMKSFKLSVRPFSTQHQKETITCKEINLLMKRSAQFKHIYTEQNNYMEVPGNATIK